MPISGVSVTKQGVRLNTFSKVSPVRIPTLSNMCDDATKQFVPSWLAVQGVYNTSRPRVILWTTVGVVDGAVNQDRKLLQLRGVALSCGPRDATKVLKFMRIATSTGGEWGAVHSSYSIGLGDDEAASRHCIVCAPEVSLGICIRSLACY